MSSLFRYLDRFFHLRANNTDIQTECLAGLTTFATMAYVLAVVPNVLADVGLDKGASLTALVFFVCLSTVAMGLYANRPFALAPGMTSVAIVGTVVAQGVMPIDVVFGAIFVSGVLFVLTTYIGLRELVVKAIPGSIKISISAGIGLFIALIGLKSSGIVVANAKSNTFVFGDLTDPKAMLFCMGFLFILILEVRKIKGSIIIAILLTTILGIPMGLTQVPETWFHVPKSMADVAFAVDIVGVFKAEYVPWIFVFFVTDFFSLMGAILGVGNRAGWIDKNGNMDKIEQCFKVDSVSSVAGSLFCMPTMTTYLESASGVEAGGRTGLTAICTAFFFAITLLFTAVALMIPSAATGPVLAYIGFQMLTSMRKINYDDKTEYLPAFIAIAMTLLTFNIASGLALAVLAYLVLKLCAGQANQIHKAMYGFAVFLIYYLYTVI